jgi:hypothetical protein
MRLSRAALAISLLISTSWLSSSCGGDSDGEFTSTGGSAGDGPDASSGGSTAGSEQSGGVSNQGGASSTEGGAAGDTGSAGAAGDGGSGPTCGTFGTPCATDMDCCSNACDPDTLSCSSTVDHCAPEGSDCSLPTDCCNLSCVGAKCSETHCVSDAGTCSSDDECCSGHCDPTAGCVPLNTSCKTTGNECSTNGQCCSGLCNGDGHCSFGSSYCIQPGDACSRDEDCCSANCVIEDGRRLGTCAAPPSGPANCSRVEGMLCTDCNQCCSRLCAPYATSNVKICQPASGCRVTGELCRRDEDCCGGSDTSGLPGYGNVSCLREPGAVLGICRSPRNDPRVGDNSACSPQGNICHYDQNDVPYACNISSSSARNNCCGGLGGKNGVCRVDNLGVPRCNGLGDICRMEGETCASSIDCCNGVPCVPDELGELRCGGGECIPSGGSCTINADCCPGTTCIRPPGSTVGMCGTDNPPGTGGAGGTGGSGGTGGAGGTGGSGGGTTTCSTYGQICNSTQDCCNAMDGVSCSGGICRYAL